MRTATLGLRRISTSPWNVDRFGVWSPERRDVVLASLETGIKQKAPKEMRFESKILTKQQAKDKISTTTKVPALKKDLIRYISRNKTKIGQVQSKHILKLLGEVLYADPDYRLSKDMSNTALKALSYAPREVWPVDNTVALIVDLAMQSLENGDMAAVENALRHTEVYANLKSGPATGFDSYQHWAGYQIVSLAVSQNLLTAALAMSARLQKLYGPHPAVADLLFSAISLHPLHKKASLITLFASIEDLTAALERTQRYIVDELIGWAMFQEAVPTSANEIASFLLKHHPEKLSETMLSALITQNLEAGNPWGAAELWEARIRDPRLIPPATVSSMLRTLTKSPDLHPICIRIIEGLPVGLTASLSASVVEFCAISGNLELATRFMRAWERVGMTDRPRHVLTALLHFAVVSRNSVETDALSQEIKRREGRLSLYETQLLVTHMVKQSIKQGLQYVAKMEKSVGIHMYAAIAELLRDDDPEVALGCVKIYQNFMATGGQAPDQPVVDKFAETQVNLVLQSGRREAEEEAMTLVQQWGTYDGVDLRTLTTEKGQAPSRESMGRMLFAIIERASSFGSEVESSALAQLENIGISRCTIDFVRERQSVP